jgi:triacylglycerol lipase
MSVEQVILPPLFAAPFMDKIPETIYCSTMRSSLPLLLLVACSPQVPIGTQGGGDASVPLFDVSHPMDAQQQRDAATPRLDIGFGKEDSGAVVDPCDAWQERLQLNEQMMANPGFGRRRLNRPIVLHHGMAGFRELGPLEYFSDAPSHLRGLGYEVYLTQVAPIDGSETRSAELEAQLICINRIAGSDGVHLVGHSQGGIDARMVASRQGDNKIIHSLTTLATPHRGSAAADAFLATPLVGRGLLTQALLQIYSGLVGRADAEADLEQQMEEMSREYMVVFNDETPDHPDVVYRSWAGRSVGSRFDPDRAEGACNDGVHANPSGRDVVDILFALIQPSVSRAQGPNDGLVAVSSAKWGLFMGCVPADHLDEVGMMGDAAPQRFSGFSYLELFETLAEDLGGP